MKKTPLSDMHEKMSAKMVDFAGWWMPVQYEGLSKEHHNVRENVGLFDVSHMGEIWVRGPKSVESLQWMTTNDISKLEEGDAHYSLFPNHDGGIVDDLIVYCVKKNEEYLLCVNASNKDKDLAYLLENNKGAEIIDESDNWAQVAIQGPKAVALTEKVFAGMAPGEDISKVTYFKFCPLKLEDGSTGYLARTGYTGEDGFEVFLPQSQAEHYWTQLMEQGSEFSVQAIGLGARDTLRMEMKYCLYGNDIDDATNPYEAGLGWVVKPQAKDFIAKDKILAVKEKGIEKKLVGFKVLERGIPRSGYELFSSADLENAQKTGYVTSGTMSPSLGCGIAMAYIDKDLAVDGTEVFVDIRGRRVKAQVVKSLMTK